MVIVGLSYKVSNLELYLQLFVNLWIEKFVFKSWFPCGNDIWWLNWLDMFRMVKMCCWTYERDGFMLAPVLCVKMYWMKRFSINIYFLFFLFMLLFSLFFCFVLFLFSLSIFISCSISDCGLPRPVTLAQNPPSQDPPITFISIIRQRETNFNQAATRAVFICRLKFHSLFWTKFRQVRK